ncbi:MAG: hypothetical protein J3R72DRAFT_451439 [Linnemannia gamsii]|nr:MAG: hypothetical protein J3R72DRAFT_451439 [Linnemannia gamsii]
MRFSIIAVVASILSVALAQQAYPTVPIASTVWNAGSTVNIRWKLNPPAATAGLKVELLTGDNPQSQRVVAVLGTGAPGATSLSAALSATLKSGYYTIRIGDSYSSYFVIRGEGAVPTGPLPTAATTTPVLPATTTVPPTPIVPTAAPLPIITTTSPSGSKPTGSGAGFLKAGAVAPVAAAAAAVVLALAF